MTAINDGNGWIGVETIVNGMTHRSCISPGTIINGEWVPTDLTDYDDDVKALAAEIWTEGLVNTFRDQLVAQAAAASVVTIDDYKIAVQSHIDAVARAKDYDSGVSLAGYITDPNPDYANVAQSFINWRSGVWILANETLAAVQSGQMAQPTISELIAMLPQPPWPVEG